MKKLLSLTLALVLSLSLCIPAFAVEQSGRVTHTYDLGDGIIATVVVESNVENRPQGRMYFSDVASPRKTFTHNMTKDEGNFLDVRVWNDASKSSGIEMDVTFQVTANGKVTNIPAERVEPAGRAYVQIQSNNGGGLTARVVTTIEAANASSVPYTFVYSPEWK